MRAAGCVFAEDEARLLVEDRPDAATLEARVVRRVAGEPLEHVLGWVELLGRRVPVCPGVFVPRQRSAHLVTEAARHLPRGGVLVDACCGSGALGLVALDLVGGCELHATEIDPVAVACARHALAPVGGVVHEGDLMAPLSDRLRGRVDVVLANVPYVPTAALGSMPAEARDHEPVSTHDGGPDGLDVLRRLAASAAHWLAPGGHLLVETSPEQAAAAVEVVVSAGLDAAPVPSSEHRTVAVVGRRPPAWAG